MKIHREAPVLGISLIADMDAHQTVISAALKRQRRLTGKLA
jgi:hypothetical protein